MAMQERAPWERPGPSAKESADIGQKEASTSRTTTLTPLEAKEKRLIIQEKERKAKEASDAKAAAAEAAKSSAEKDRQLLRGFLEDITRARRLLSNPMATGPAAQLTGGIFATPGANLEALITALKSPIVLEAMKRAREGSKAGATGFGSLAIKEMELLASGQGSLSLKQSPEQLLKTLDRIDQNTRRFMAYNAGYDPAKPEGAALAGLPLPAGSEPPPPTGGEVKGGEWKSNPELAGVDAAVTSMIKAGRRPDEIKQWLNEYQPGLGDRAKNLETNVENWKKNSVEPNVTIERQFVPSESPLSEVGAGPAGAFVTGAAEQLTGGFLDELTGDRQRASTVMRGLREQNPNAYAIGNVGGAIASAVLPEALAAKYGLRLPALLQGLPQNMLYGAGSAEPGERLSGAAYEGLMTPVTNIAGNLIGKAVSAPLKGADEGLRRLASNYGINLTPGQMTGGKGLEQTLSGMPIVGPQIRARRNETLEQFNKAAFDEGLAPIGVQVTAPGQKGIGEAQQAVSEAYNEALGGVALLPDQEFAQQVRGKAYSELGKVREIGPELQKEVDDIFARHASPDGTISGEGMQNALQDIQKLKTAYKADPRWGKRIAPQLDEISDGYSGLLERQFPENYEKFQNANEAYRNVSILEKAVDFGAEGDIFSPGNLRAATRQGTARFGGKKASARGERPFNELVMPALDTIPAKFDDVSLAGRLANPAVGAGIGAGYGGVTMLTSDEGDKEPGASSGTLPAPLAYGLLGAGLAAIPYSRAGTRGMSALMRGERTPRQQKLGDLVETYFPAAFRGAVRGATAEPGVPSPQNEAPLLDQGLQELLNKTQFAAPAPEETDMPQGELKVINGRAARLDDATGLWVDVETGQPVSNYARGGMVFASPVR